MQGTQIICGVWFVPPVLKYVGQSNQGEISAIGNGQAKRRYDDRDKGMCA